MWDTERTRVKLVSQLSETAAKTVKYVGKKEFLKRDTCEEIGDFIVMGDFWLDLMNSRTSYEEEACNIACAVNVDMCFKKWHDINKSAWEEYLYQFQIIVHK